MTENVITINHISKVYKLYNKPIDRLKETFGVGKRRGKEFYALNNVSFSIARGETVGVIGRNGSGKSTILKILTGVLNPTQGELQINGKISALLELGAGFNMEYTGMENIYLNATIMNIPRDEIEKKIPEILAFADIGEHIHQPVKTYSSGMFVRLAFAVAINVNPDILIVDEALAVGDTRFQLKCMDKFVEFMEAGKTVLFVSHDINSIKRFCKRSIWLNAGEVVMDGETDEVTDRYMDYLKSGLKYAEYAKLQKPETVETEEQMQDEQTQEEQTQVEKVQDKEFQEQQEMEVEESPTVSKEECLAEIKKLEFYDAENNPITKIRHNSPLKVKVTYHVHDTDVNHPVLGVAIRDAEDRYICGVNTLLDNISIPWEQGENICWLTYNTFNLVGGTYYFDAAVFDKTATVPLDYASRINSIFVKMEYIAEGILVFPHKWTT